MDLVFHVNISFYHSFNVIIVTILDTTRNPRNGELNGQDYHFVTKEEFDQLIKNDSMVEWAQFSQNMYGTSKEALKNVQSTGKTCILDIELEGVKSIKKSGIEAKFILIKAPNLQELKSRLIERGSENEASLESRLKRAKDDLEYAEKHNLYDITIINDNVENSFQEFKEYCLCYSSEK